MNSQELTSGDRTATSLPMQDAGSGNRRSRRHGLAVLVMVMGSAAALGGCVSVNAPDKPIVIELNINIKQEVIYRLAADAGNTITDNPEIF